MSTVMVVEDDAALRLALATNLQSGGYTVVPVGSAEECLTRAGVDDPDLVLLDLGLPGLDGLEALERLRAVSDVPIVVLTVRTGLDDKLAALDGGADDYVLKPFDTDELLARIRAALRRRSTAPERPAVVYAGNVTIDLLRGEVTVDGAPVRLTANEFRFLSLLVRSDGRLVTQRQVAEHLDTGSGPPDPGTLRVYVAQLRKKLGDDAADPRLILTYFGLGYRWIGSDDAPDDASRR
jgi:two-component system KDP operon response regulator KdpE